MKDRQFLAHHLNRALMLIIQQYGVIRMDGLEITIEIFHYTYDQEQCSTSLHQHPFYELSLMTRGATSYCTGESKTEISAQDGHFIMIPPHVIHQRFTTQAPANIAGFQLQLNAVDPALKPMLQRLPEELAIRGYEFPAMPEAARSLRLLYRELRQRRPFWQTRGGGLLHDFLVVFFRHNLPQLSVGGMPDYTGQNHQEYLVILAERYIEENLGRPLAIDEVAAHCCVSKRHLNRIYSAMRGISLGQRIIIAKIDYSRRLLLQNDLLVKDIAGYLGFSSISYFCRIFKQVAGCTPEQYRKR